MKIGAGGQGLAVGLKGVFLCFKEEEVVANVIEDFVLFEFYFFGDGFSLHNDY